MRRALFAIGLVLASVTSSAQPPSEAKTDDDSSAALAPRLLAKNAIALVHFVPAAPSEERWDWAPYGQLLATSIEDGTMRRLMTAGVEGLPTRRMKYVETRIEAVGLDGDRLYVLSSTTMTWDRPPTYGPEGSKPEGRAGAPETDPRLRSISVFALPEGKIMTVRSLREGDDLKSLGLPAPTDPFPVALDAEQRAALKRFVEEPAK